MPIRASQDFHIDENYFVDLSLHINRPIGASQELHCGKNCFLDLSWDINRLMRA